MVGLNAQQQRAVRYTHNPLLVLAGAGSGKTRVITEKIAYLIHHLEYRPDQIFAVTFTNKAAKEMRQRVAKLVSADLAKRLNVSTFHTLGLRFLNEEGKHLGLRRGMTIMDTADSLSALKSLRAEPQMDGPGEDDALRQQISTWKNDCISIESALASATTPQDHYSAQVYQRYSELLLAYNAVDFDDLIGLPLRLLTESEEVRERWQNRVRHLLVDEYQDTNAAQYALVKALVGQSGRLTAVGDDDQSIYAWRGARPENLNTLQQDFPNLELIKLEQNYRSTSRILRCANQLIANNPHAFEKKLWSDIGLGDPLKVVECGNGEEESDWVSSAIHLHRLKHRTHYRDYAILFRGNFQAKSLERALREKNIPYRLQGSKSFFDKTEIKDVLAYLRLISNPADDAAFLRIINTPRREIGASTVEKLSLYARERNVPLLSACSELGVKMRLSERAYTRVSEFVHFIGQFSEIAQSEPPEQVLQSLLESLRYAAWLRESSDNPKAGERRWSDVQELLGWITRLSLPDEENNVRTLADVVTHLALVDMLDQRQEEDNSDQVTLMTLHASKGLEFPHVYLVGFEEDLLPHRSSIDLGNVEEERRLAYVGLTRGKQTVTMTYTRARSRFGELIATEISRFLAELPPDDLQYFGRKDQPEDPERSRQVGKEMLADLKALLRD